MFIVFVVLISVLSQTVSAAPSAMPEVERLRIARATADANLVKLYSNQINEIIREAKRVAPIPVANAYQRSHFGFRDARPADNLRNIVNAIIEAHIFDRNYDFDFMANYADQSKHTTDFREVVKNQEHLQVADFVHRFTKQALYGIYRDRLSSYSTDASPDRGFREILEAMNPGKADSLRPSIAVAKNILHKDYFKHLEGLILHYKPAEAANALAKQLSALNKQRLSRPIAAERHPIYKSIFNILSASGSTPQERALLARLYASPANLTPELQKAIVECIVSSLSLNPASLTKAHTHVALHPLYDQALAVVPTRNISRSAVLSALFPRAEDKNEVNFLMTAAANLRAGRYDHATMCPSRDLPCLLKSGDFARYNWARGARGAFELTGSITMGFPGGWSQGITGKSVKIGIIDQFTANVMATRRALLGGKAVLHPGFVHQFVPPGRDDLYVHYHGYSVAAQIAANITPRTFGYGLAADSTSQLFGLTTTEKGVQAYDAMISMGDIDIINMSGVLQRQYYAAIERATVTAGIIVVIAAGNSGFTHGESIHEHPLPYFINQALRGNPQITDLMQVVSVLNGGVGHQHPLFTILRQSDSAGTPGGNAGFNRRFQDVFITSTGPKISVREAAAPDLHKMAGTSGAAPFVSAALALLIQHFNDQWQKLFYEGDKATFDKARLNVAYKKHRGKIVISALRSGAFKSDPVTSEALAPAIFGSGVVNVKGAIEEVDEYFSKQRNLAKMADLNTRMMLAAFRG